MSITKRQELEAKWGQATEEKLAKTGLDCLQVGAVVNINHPRHEARWAIISHEPSGIADADYVRYYAIFVGVDGFRIGEGKLYSNEIESKKLHSVYTPEEVGFLRNTEIKIFS